MLGALGSFLSSIAAPVAVAATAYSAYNNYRQAKNQTNALKAQNARNARLQEDAIRRARARNLAAMSSSGLAVTGTPQIILQDDDRLAQEDTNWQARINAADEKQAKYNTTGTAFSGLANTYAYGQALK